MQRSDCQPTDLDHVNAHGSSRRNWDLREATAICETLGDVPVMAPRSYFGSLGAGSGAAETVASVLALSEGHVPGVLNHEETDPDCRIQVIRPEGKKCEGAAAMLMNQSTTGQAVAMVIGRA